MFASLFLNSTLTNCKPECVWGVFHSPFSLLPSPISRVPCPSPLGPTPASVSLALLSLDVFVFAISEQNATRLPQQQQHFEPQLHGEPSLTSLPLVPSPLQRRRCRFEVATTAQLPPYLPRRAHQLACASPTRNSRASRRRSALAGETRSVVVHAFSGAGIEGPYNITGVVFAPRRDAKPPLWDSLDCHNPTVHKIGREYVVFYIGVGVPEPGPPVGAMHDSAGTAVGVFLGLNLNLTGFFFPALHCPTLAVRCALLRAHAHRMLIGACLRSDPMLRPFDLFRATCRKTLGRHHRPPRWAPGTERLHRC